MFWQCLFLSSPVGSDACNLHCFDVMFFSPLAYQLLLRATIHNRCFVLTSSTFLFLPWSSCSHGLRPACRCSRGSVIIESQNSFNSSLLPSTAWRNEKKQILKYRRSIFMKLPDYASLLPPTCKKASSTTELGKSIAESSKGNKVMRSMTNHVLKRRPKQVA